MEDACIVALATAYNARETEGGTTKQELLHFVEEVSLCVVCVHVHSFSLSLSLSLSTYSSTTVVISFVTVYIYVGICG